MRPVLAAPMSRARRARLLVGVLCSVGLLGLMAAQHAAADSPSFAQSAAPYQLPSGADLSFNWDPNATACATSDSCVIVGDYQDASSDKQAYVEAITDGSAAPQAVKVTLPDNANANPGASLEDVSCQANGTCEAYGVYHDTSNVTPVDGGADRQRRAGQGGRGHTPR